MEIIDIWEKVKSIVDEALDNPSVTVSLENQFREVEGWESLVHIQVISEIEEVFGISLNTEKLEVIDNFKGLCEHIQECGI